MIKFPEGEESDGEPAGQQDAKSRESASKRR